MAWSKYQQDVFDFVANGSGSAVISAVAGSGKTTTIVECAKRIPSNKKVLFLAFNKTIANELSARLAAYPNVKCQTLHSLGFSALMKASGNRRVNCYNNKQYQYVSNNIDILSDGITEETTDLERNLFIRNVTNLLDKCRLNLVSAKDKKQIEQIADHHGIDLFADEISVVSTLLETAYTYHVGDKIDFTDMLTLPTMNKTIGKFVPKYDWVFIDECQDLSKAQRELMLLAIANNGRFIAVGDRYQAINGFAGAGCDSFDLLAKLANDNELPLSVNYRCGKEIIVKAQEIVPHIEAYKDNILGEVIDTNTLKDVKGGDMILCRTSAPLVRLCLKMLANNMIANVKGRDLGENLLKLVDRMKAKNIHYLYIKLDNELERIKKAQASKGVKNVDNCTAVVSFQDKIECIKAFAEVSSGISDLKQRIEYVFADEQQKNAICLSTVHKSKGLESDRVFIILPQKLPLTWRGQKDWEYQQEMNLKYVAITRAKKALYIVNLDDTELTNYKFDKANK